MPAATPPCDNGIPATALFVITGWTIPIPMPNSTYAGSSQRTAVCRSNPVSMSVLI
jgi:hypothetical protein